MQCNCNKENTQFIGSLGIFSTGSLRVEHVYGTVAIAGPLTSATIVGVS